MNAIKWRRPEPSEPKLFGTGLFALADLPEGVKLLVWLVWDIRSNAPSITVGVCEPRSDAAAPGRIRTTDSSAHWADIEPFWPRSTWPREVWAGEVAAGTVDEHDAPPDLRRILDRKLAEYALMR